MGVPSGYVSRGGVEGRITPGNSTGLRYYNHN